MPTNKNFKTLPLKEFYVKNSSIVGSSYKKNIKVDMSFTINVRFIDDEIVAELEYSLFSLNSPIDMFVKIIIIFEKDEDIKDDELKTIAENMNNIIKANEKISKFLDENIHALSTLLGIKLPTISEIPYKKQ
jgi:hypothetical protein